MSDQPFTPLTASAFSSADIPCLAAFTPPQLAALARLCIEAQRCTADATDSDAVAVRDDADSLLQLCSLLSSTYDRERSVAVTLTAAQFMELRSLLRFSVTAFGVGVSSTKRALDQSLRSRLRDFSDGLMPESEYLQFCLDSKRHTADVIATYRKHSDISESLLFVLPLAMSAI